MPEVIQSGESKILYGSTKKESEGRAEFFKLFEQCPIPKDQILNHIGLFARRQVLSRILMLNELYKKIIPLHGIVCEFGVQWGTNLALFESFRGMYEPYNHNRKIVGFDTFAGFEKIHQKDGDSKIMEKGSYATTKNYENYLEAILKFHESESPIPHIKKFELVKGDACATIHKYLKEHPETIIAFAFFDFDVYQPTAECLKAILPHLTKGAIVAFDELNVREFPGETAAFNEVLGINKYKIHRDVNNPTTSYIIYE
jgi:hypothetical protein